MSERKPKLEWERVEVEEDFYQWWATVGDLFTLFVDDDEAADWEVCYSGVPVQCESGSAQGIEAAKIAAEDYALSELAKAVSDFGKMAIVEWV